MENPKCRLNDDTKISSYQKNLTTKLTLTPKIIGNLRDWYPDTLLIGCKLLEGVPKAELYDVAQHLAEKNRMDYIMANDLADLRIGRMTRHLVTQDGFTGVELADPEDIFRFVDEKLK
jgi:phosphopantothenate-cysteine ligase